MNKVIRLTSILTDSDNKNIIVRVFPDSIGAYWSNGLESKGTVIMCKNGICPRYLETPEEIDRMLGIEEPVK